MTFFRSIVGEGAPRTPEESQKSIGFGSCDSSEGSGARQSIAINEKWIPFPNDKKKKRHFCVFKNKRNVPLENILFVYHQKLD